MTAPVNATPSDQWLSDISSGIGVASGLAQGGTQGDVKAGVSGGELASKFGAFGDYSKAVGGGLADLSNLAGIYQGIEQKGFLGYGGAAVNAAALGSRLGAFGGYSSLIGNIANPVAAALATYSFAKNWKSGAAGADALGGANAGAAIGTAILPGVGTLIGLGIGAAVGAASSMFGPGREDPENAVWDHYAAAYDKGGAKGVSGATPSQNYQLLAGIFDARSSAIPFYGKYGRMGEGKFTADMFSQINQAFASGKIPQGMSADKIYSQVVQPWITSMGGANGWQNTSTKEGSSEKAAVGNMLTSMIAQWQAGRITSQSKLGIKGQTIPNVPAPGGLGYGANKSQARVSEATQPTQDAILTMPGMGSGSDASAASMLPAVLAIPGLALGASGVADPNNPAATTGTGSSGTDPNAGGGGSFLSDLGSGISNFLSSPLGQTAEFATLGGIGMAEASSQRSENQQQAGKLAAAGAPFTKAGQDILTQLEGGAQVGGPLGSSIKQQTDTAASLGETAKQYSTGNLTPAQQQQIKDFISQQRAMVDSQLASSGNLDSSARQAAYQQIDTKAAELQESLTSENLQISESALGAVQSTYSGLLNQALSSSEFGFSTEQAAVTTLIQSDTQLAGQLQQLFAGIAQGYGNAVGGGKKTNTAGSAAGSAASAVGRAVSSIGGKGVASTPAGGDTSGPAAGFVQGGEIGGTDFAPGVSEGTSPNAGTGFGTIPTTDTGSPDWLSAPDSGSSFNATDPFGG